MKCVFCTNLNNYSIFNSSKNFNAIYNIAPILPGHSLIIPKKHIVSFNELNDDLASELILFSKQIIEGLQKAFQTKEFNFTIQDGTSAGQTIMHLHAHIIPRNPNDLKSPGDWYPKLEDNFYHKAIDSSLRPTISNSELLQITSYLKQLFN